MQFVDGELVSNDKLLLYIDTKIIGRPAEGTRRKKRARTDDSGDFVIPTISERTVEGEVSAIMSLWNFQYSSPSCPVKEPPMRSEAPKVLLKSNLAREASRKKEEFEDRALGTLQDGYNTDQMADIVRFCWEGWEADDPKRLLPVTIESHLRTAVDFLFCHTMLLRGENIRAAQLPDLFGMELENEGPMLCPMVFMIMNNGKTNQLNRLEYGIAARHRHVQRCPMGHLAFYLFFRWNILREEPPIFSRREQWYGIHMLRGVDRLKPLAYHTQKEWIKRSFRAAGLTSTSKCTHMERSQGAREAERAGVNEAQIRRAGRWNNDVLSQCYLSNLPRKFVRATAGFDPSLQGCYYLPRAAIQPPETLVHELWPWVDEWAEWYERGLGDQADDRRDIAGQGFLRLLKLLRPILLQDSVLQMAKFPSHPIWTDPIFHRDDFKAFRRQLEQSLSQDTGEPEEVQIRRAVPAIADQLSQLRGTVLSQIEQSKQEILEKLAGFDDFIQGRVPFVLSPVHDGPLAATTRAALTRPGASPDVIAGVEAGTGGAGTETGASLDAVAGLPKYRLSRTISTVPDLWREWTVGFGNGPSVQSLEDSYGPRWRPSQEERVFFCRRKVIINWIRAKQRERPNTEATVIVMELERYRRQQRASLAKLVVLLKQGPGP
ncbi:uncharacterized protein LDX57_013066 [Aspergillus melleus]|uniref:uncharacterized protein n=1 Tax=Aspergillus melleus TaxID=138277 RepID=UPI001E8D9A01|nr:uncharacterized protein LDX57_013066 [Aspergillus melleus]KAH8430197.1 hypothetical protein LDX57_013066 [Aspergillus melleus]